MIDSIRHVEDDYIRRINCNRGSGRLHKGHSITAATSSIPSKYQTIVIDKSERKGFLSRVKRFGEEADLNDNPGPGSYVGHHEAQKLGPSFSKKGTGGFASKDRRISKHSSTHSPGSAAYGLPGFVEQRHDFNKANTTSNFHTPIAQNVDHKKKGTPAPNHYEITPGTKLRGKMNNVTAQAQFRSRTERDTFNVKDSATRPAPWSYQINEELVKGSVPEAASSFKSRTERRMAPDPEDVPGPGAYKPHEPIDHVKKTVFPRKHYLCISAPAMPLPCTPPSPGPTAYDVVDYEGPERHYMSGSVFVSSTSRWTGGPKMQGDIPGPAHYRPTGVSKQSFNYNAQGRWI